jgi:hypothetical protein
MVGDVALWCCILGERRANEAVLDEVRKAFEEEREVRRRNRKEPLHRMATRGAETRVKGEEPYQ